MANSFGVPIKQMPGFLDLKSDIQDQTLKNYGIPCDSANNEFKEWVRAARKANRDLKIAIKADQATPYDKIKNVMSSLQDIKRKPLQSAYVVEDFTRRRRTITKS